MIVPPSKFHGFEFAEKGVTGAGSRKNWSLEPIASLPKEGYAGSDSVSPKASSVRLNFSAMGRARAMSPAWMVEELLLVEMR